jgi:protocatechuate 3,4-dioxygenase, alpha subunit
MPELTPSQTVGPFLSIGLPWEAGPVAGGDGVRIAGVVLDGAGDPVPDALVETWDPDSRAFARCPTDDEGRWHVVTPPAPHLGVNVFARGLLHRVVTRIYLQAPGDHDPVLARVPAERRATLLARPTGDGFAFDIRLQGPGETVFFDVDR